MFLNINRLSVISMTKQQGFGLVEVMIAMTLGLLILAGISQYYVSGNRTDATTQALNQITDNARFIANKLGREVRMAGYIGPMQSVTVQNTFADPGDLTIANNFAVGITGFNNVTSAGMTTEVSTYLDDDPEPIDNTDMVVFRTTQDVQPIPLTATSTTNSISVPKNIASSRSCNTGTAISGICADDSLLISDLRNALFFQASSITANASGAVIAHSEADEWSSITFNNTAEVVPYQTITYFLAEGENGRSALFRKENAVDAVELIPNVANFQVEYGVDSNGDKSVDGSYAVASAVTNWGNVLSVRFSLLLASENNGVVDTPMNVSAPLFPNGTSTAPNGDRRLYKSLIFTAALRNRIQ